MQLASSFVFFLYIWLATLCHKAMHNLSDAKTIMLPGTSDRFSVLTVISVIACGNIAGK